jgi:tetratricopeptide (TPR) repeat protein
MEKRPKLIVLPLAPDKDQEYNGIGLGIHFLIGNMIAVHSSLAECWFGCRVNKIFKSVPDLQAFCKGKSLNINRVAKQQKIRFWLDGRYRQEKNIIWVFLTLYDAELEKNYHIHFCLDPSDFFLEFGRNFFLWLDQCNLPLDHQQRKKALWKENINIQGLDYLGRAVETTYKNYIDPSLFKDGFFDLEWFEKAVNESPLSYLSHNLMGWAFYKNEDYKKSRDCFQKALEKNKAGFGALAGMMYCHIFEKNRTKALEFSLARADVKQDSHDIAIKFIEKKF